jgi:exopolysaccharide biosynthesis WecB/TagA/CpsF family protein
MDVKAGLPHCSILGTEISVTDMRKTTEYLGENLDSLRGQYICVSNVHTTVMASRDERYRAVQNGAALALPDGKPLSFVSRRRGFPEARRVAGPDLMTEIFKASREKGYRHYFYGATQSTLDILREKLQERYPYLVIAGMYAPPFYASADEIPAADDAADIDRINAARPDFIWVGLGAPKQEYWMAAHEGKLCGVMIGVGAGFDFHAGTVKRAPRWMQESYLEWLFRIMQDPKRLLKRYITTNFAFVAEVRKESRRLRRERRNGHLRLAMIGHKRIPGREGGVEVVVGELAVRLAQGGDDVTAYNRRSGKHHADEPCEQKEYCGVRLVQVPTFENSRLNAIVYSAFASVRMLFGRYDVVHYHAEGPCIMLWLPKLFGIPTVATIHGLDWQRSKWGNFASKMLKKGEKRAARRADALIVLSRNMQQYFRDTYGRSTIFIPNGIERPEYRNADFIRQKWGLEKDGYVLFLARLVPEKGIHYLIDAFKGVHTDKKLVIAGGAGGAADYAAKIRESAAEDPRILFTDFVGGTPLEELYSNCAVFVLPSDVEGMAMSLLEAMSYGRCCVVSDIPENTEVTGTHALTFPKGDVGKLRELLQRLLDDPAERARYEQGAADYICSRYSWDASAKATREVYLSVLKPARRAQLAQAQRTGSAQERTQPGEVGEAK